MRDPAPIAGLGKSIDCIIYLCPAGAKMEAERINAIANSLSDLDARAQDLRGYL